MRKTSKTCKMVTPLMIQVVQTTKNSYYSILRYRSLPGIRHLRNQSPITIHLIWVSSNTYKVILRVLKVIGKEIYLQKQISMLTHKRKDFRIKSNLRPRPQLTTESQSSFGPSTRNAAVYSPRNLEGTKLNHQKDSENATDYKSQTAR